MTEPIYHFDHPIHAVHRRRYRRRRLLLIVVLVVFGAAAAFLIHDLQRLKNSNNKKPVGATYQQQIAGPQTFRNAYFQFSDTSKWVFSTDNSRPNRQVYFLYQAGLPAHMLTVYINQTPSQDDLAATRVLPVQIKDGNALTLSGDVSDTCGKQYQPTDLKRVRVISLSGTSLLCVPDSPQFIVVVGQVGGDYNLTLKRADGSMARYIIMYHNLTVDPDPAPFVRIMKTFQAV